MEKSLVCQQSGIPVVSRKLGQSKLKSQKVCLKNNFNRILWFFPTIRIDSRSIQVAGEVPATPKRLPVIEQVVNWAL